MNVNDVKNMPDGAPVAPALQAYVSQVGNVFPNKGKFGEYLRRSIKLQDASGEIECSLVDEPFQPQVGQFVTVAARASQGKSQLSGAVKETYRGQPQIRITKDRISLAQPPSNPAVQPALSAQQAASYAVPAHQAGDIPFGAQGQPQAPSYVPPRAPQKLTEAGARALLLRNAEAFLRVLTRDSEGAWNLSDLLRQSQPEAIAMAQAWSSGILMAVERGQIERDAEIGEELL